MTIIYVTIFLLLTSVALFIVGKVMISRDAFKFGAGTGLGVLLIPGFTPWFSFYKLEREGKEIWITLWMAGIVLAIVTVAGFFSPVSDVFSGKAFHEDYLKPVYTKPAQAAEEEPAVKEEPKETAPAAAGADAGAAPAAPAAGADAPADKAAAPADKAAAPADKAAAPADKAAAPADKAAAPADK